MHDAGPDPRSLAPGFAQLGVLPQTGGEHAADLAADLVRLGRGRLGHVRSFHDVVPALHRVFSG